MNVDCRLPCHDENYSSLFVENSHPETLHRDMCIACSGSSALWNIKLPCYTFGFHDLGICNRISFPYPQTFLSVGISNETSFSYPQTFHSVGISNETSFSYPQTFHSVGISNKTSFSYPQTFHSVGISNKTSC